MLEPTDQLLRRIRRGEDSFLECKEMVFAGSKVKGPARNDLADELAAFANSRGGTLVLGVEDKSRDVVGIPIDRLDAAVRFVSDVAQDSIRPSLAPVIERLELPDTRGRAQPIVRVEVDRSLFVHESPSGYLHRVGDAKRRMDPQYLARLFQHRSQARLIRFDEQRLENALFSDLDASLIQRFTIPEAVDELPVLARKLGMATAPNGAELRPTVAGILLGAPQPERWLTHAYVQAVAYRGRTVKEALDSPWYQLDAADIRGPLDAQVKAACQFVVRNQRVRARKSLGRQDQPQYDMTAVFEAVVNAVAHRDYSMHGSRIRLHVFADRIELYSPGALVNTLTVGDLAYRQASRNETLASLLARCPVPSGIAGLQTSRSTLMDRRGEGVPIILQRSLQLSGKRPEYRMFGDELRLTVYAAHAPEA